MKKIFRSLAFLAIFTLIFTGCSNNKSNISSKDIKFENTDLKDIEQFAEPKKGETIAELVVKDYGSIYVKFFEDVAPKAVENFVTKAKEGYYEGVIFHRVIEDFMIQGGDPTGTGTSGESIWKKDFEDEFSDNIHPYRGSLCMANAGENTNGSQFFIVQAKPMKEDEIKSIAESYKDYFNYEVGDDVVENYRNILTYLYEYEQDITNDVIENYVKIGGTPWLFKKHTVFGQMISGYDVLDAIVKTETDEYDKPVKDVVIEKINIYEYK